ncbi:family 1 glycosylhydrolase [uncultured Sphingomonas sp.]|uniref:family 1 glycosylhydrolase n=1 Tax=uncultured Sphingomonas sp. TaxID=158754 RepID=UPI0035CC92CE
MFRDAEIIHARAPSSELELWGGHECTVNRVGNHWYDQTIRNGHQHRIDDLRLFADLGIRSLRYPVLWERIAPRDPNARDFDWTDERLKEIRRLGMNPIATLCHHGSGPHYTSLIDGGFAPGLASHAAAVARRYPWMRDYTPVNEPLTTARFSALYGFWYPHTRDEGLFWRALLNEIDATRLAMKEIRRVNPAARLIQTDDIGYCHATPPLQHEADFQNERRWMGWDLLCGMVVPGHALWQRLASFGFGERLRAIADDPCPPDVIGINHYLSSERLLDHRVALHGDRAAADREIGRCGDIDHVDVDAIRAVPERVVGLRGLIEQTWQRYGLPVAITESHLGSHRQDQARWFIDAWRIANDLRSEGVDVRAVTAWSLLGAFDWNQMVTRSAGHYETGVFDVRHDQPRPTLMVSVLKDLSSGRVPGGPGLETRGWWCADRQSPRLGMHDRAAPRPILILGDAGPLAMLAALACEQRGLPHRIGHELHEAAILDARPCAVLDVRTGPQAKVDHVARACSSLSIPGARLIADHAPEARESTGLLVARVGSIFTAVDDDAWPVRLLAALHAGEPVRAREDVRWTGCYGPTLIDGMLDLLVDGATGTVSFVPHDCVSQAAFAVNLAAAADVDPESVIRLGVPVDTFSNDRLSHVPSTGSMAERFVREWRATRLASSEEERGGDCIVTLSAAADG